MVFTIEPILTDGRGDVHIAEDGWSVVTDDGSWAAQEEETILLNAESGVSEVLTTTSPDVWQQLWPGFK